MSTTVSVITPSYNQARYLEETIRSVLCQRDQVHEYFVIDGGSTDGSVEIIRKYASGIDFWSTGKDRGQSDAIQKGFQRATGDIICWLNSDDAFLPGAIRQVREAFDAHPNWDVLTGYHVAIDADTRIIAFYRIPCEDLKAFRGGVNRVCQPACFFRRQVYERVGGVNIEQHCVMDTDLWYRMMDAGATWGHVPDYLAAFRRHPMSKGSSWLQRYDQERKALHRQYPRYCPGPVVAQTATTLYRARQILSGRYLRAWLESRRHHGKPLTEVFGDWVVSP